MRTELTPEEAELLLLARAAGQLAYAPYSMFRVGAAVRTSAGTFIGCNVENASYGLSICAERAAIFHAVSAGAKRIESLAVSCLDAQVECGTVSKMPCGACRQVIAEFAGASLCVVVDGAGVWQLHELLPDPFVIS